MTQTQTPVQARGNVLQRFIRWVDVLQQKHHAVSFPYAVIKKYGDDNAGHQAALITYYGFLSLFPLLIVATSVVDLIAQHNAHLRDQLLSGINTYFPIVGKQLQAGIHGNSKTGLALLIGVVVALYGARGIADAVRSALDHAWAIPKVKRTGFPKSILKSLGILVGAGFGLLATTALTSFATAILNDAILVRLVPVIINIGLLYLIFMYVFRIGTSRKVARSSLRMGALTAAIGLLILQAVGVALIKHQLHNLQGLYGQFALVLAIMFWIYLQAQVFMYAVEINVVHARQLWPRSITGKPTTPADQNAYRLYVEAQAFRPKSEEAIEVTFHDPK